MMALRRFDSPVVVALLALGVSFLGGWMAGVSSGPEAAAPAPPVTTNASDLDLDVWARASAVNGVWIHPGLRNLDPAVFGTVAMLLRTKRRFGVPL